MGMLVWINGPGGVGKTQVAHELAHRLPGSFVCDPELLGIAIQRMTPQGLRVDTDGLGISEVAEAVARVIGLDLRPAGARLRPRLRRVLVTLRHIR